MLKTITYIKRKGTKFMKKEYQFQQNLWDPSDFLYAASARFNYRENFIQEPNCIVNRYDDVRSDYSYISMVMKDRLPDGASVSTTCSFENYGAPLIVLCEKLHTLPNGMLQYGTHFEVVPFEDGLNVWYLTLENNQVKPVALARYLSLIHIYGLRRLSKPGFKIP